MDQSEIEKIADEVMEKHRQSDEFKKRFIKFYKNTLNNNLGGTSLELLMDNVELPEGEKVNGS